jgi:hypothetical protein
MTVKVAQSGGKEDKPFQSIRHLPPNFRHLEILSDHPSHLNEQQPATDRNTMLV